METFCKLEFFFVHACVSVCGVQVYTCHYPGVGVEGNLSCQSLPSVLFETGPLVFCCVHQASCAVNGLELLRLWSISP